MIIEQTIIKIPRNAKLKSENFIMYLRVCPGSCFEYSLKVIRLAREDIRLPTPPILTPSKRCL